MAAEFDIHAASEYRSFRCQRKRATQPLDQAAAELEAAARKLSQDPSGANLAAYDVAYAAWRSLFGDVIRGPGRPTSGDEPLSSTARAQYARERQKAAAIKWERAAPLIQQLRKHVDAGDTRAAFAIATQLARQETTMSLADFQVVHAQPNSQVVVIHAFHGRDLILGFVGREALEDRFKRTSLSGSQLNLVADRNIAAIGRIMNAKFERGEHRPYSRAGSTLDRIDITLEDLDAEEMTDSVLDMNAGFAWVNR